MTHIGLRNIELEMSESDSAEVVELWGFTEKAECRRILLTSDYKEVLSGELIALVEKPGVVAGDPGGFWLSDAEGTDIFEIICSDISTVRKQFLHEVDLEACEGYDN